MDINEFKAWLDGYVEAGGKDINRVKERLNEVYIPFVLPQIPLTPYPWVIPTPIFPQPYTSWPTWRYVTISSDTETVGTPNSNDITRVTSCAMAD